MTLLVFLSVLHFARLEQIEDDSEIIISPMLNHIMSALKLISIIPFTVQRIKNILV